MSLVRETLIVEFKDLAQKAREYKKIITEAKTYTKREIYKKKLKENNIKAADVLSALNILAGSDALTTLTNKTKKEEAASGVNDEALSIEGDSRTQGSRTEVVEPGDTPRSNDN